MNNGVKLEMKKKSRLLRGLAVLLADDTDYICADADDFDIMALGVSIEETKDTVQRIVDHIAELEYMLYLTKQESR